MRPFFLFSVDLEDASAGAVPRGDRLPTITAKYLRFLDRHRARTTFFCVGDVARRFPALIHSIVDSGHEVACHGDEHEALDELGEVRFRTSLRRNRDALIAAGAPVVEGFRAPYFSITEGTVWAYKVLREEGFAYSSSVLPARNPLFGWPEFGHGFRSMDGVWELPMTTLPWRRLALPFAGGIYLRVLPLALVKLAMRWVHAQGRPVLGYVHPHDVDPEQAAFVHSRIKHNPLYGVLMQANRKALLGRLDMLARDRVIVPYGEFVAEQLARLPLEESTCRPT